jgi:hypothetical protein
MDTQQFTKEELATEEWRHVVGYEGIYSVSNLGRVRRGCVCASLEMSTLSKGRPKPYISIELSSKGRKKMFFIHALVMAAFVGPRPSGYHINHVDADKGNNRCGNLEYVTPRENSQHAVRMRLTASGDRQGLRKYPNAVAKGLRSRAYTSPETLKRGEQNPRSKLTKEQAKWAYSMKYQMSAQAVGAQLGISSVSVYHIWNGKTWRHITNHPWTLKLLRATQG